MSDYTPQVGDRVRSTRWKSHTWVDVKAVTEGMVGGPDEEQEWQWITIELQRPWEKVETPVAIPHRWIAVRLEDGWTTYARERLASGVRADLLVHVWSDETGDHAEVERL